MSINEKFIWKLKFDKRRDWRTKKIFGCHLLIINILHQHLVCWKKIIKREQGTNREVSNVFAANLKYLHKIIGFTESNFELYLQHFAVKWGKFLYLKIAVGGFPKTALYFMSLSPFGTTFGTDMLSLRTHCVYRSPSDASNSATRLVRYFQLPHYNMLSTSWRWNPLYIHFIENIKPL